VASAWLERRMTDAGDPRWIVRYRLGGMDARKRYGGSFGARRDAHTRRAWIAGELAAMRVPDLRALTDAAAEYAPSLAAAAERWQASRVDASPATLLQHRSAVRRALPLLGKRPVDQVMAQDVAALVADLHGRGKSRETIRKTVTALAMIFDHAGIAPNPARDRVHVRLPREVRAELEPPAAAHVAAVYRLLPSVYRLPLLGLEWSGARVGSVESVRVGDYDEPRRQVRLRASASKTRKALWVELPDVLAAAIEASLPPREDRDPDAPLFPGAGADRLRTAIARACRAAGVPVFSPHDLRHRRISLVHRQGRPWAEIAAFVGHTKLSVTADVYTHVLVDGRELDYGALLAA
jgi:integrase